MQVIAVLNQKGGSGKTTISTHIARALQMGGNDVLLIDSDPQGSSRDWAAVREDQPLSVVGIDRPTIERDIKSVSHKDYIVIDGAPQAHDLAVSAIKAADIIIIPVQPSPYDIWATDALVNLVKQRIELTDGKLKAFFVISRAIKNTKIGAEIEDALNGYDLPVLKTRITQRVSFASSAAQGFTVLDENKDKEAAQEINELIIEIKYLLK